VTDGTSRADAPDWPDGGSVAPGGPEAAGAAKPVRGEVTVPVASSLDLDVVLAWIAQTAQALCRSDTASIFLRVGDSDEMAPGYRVGSFPPGYESLRVRPGRGVGGRAWLTRRPARTDRYVGDETIPAEYRDVARQSGTEAIMAVPIVIAGRVEGLLYVGNRGPRGFTDADEAVAERLARQAAIALENAALFAREQRLRAVAEVMAALATELNASLDLGRVLQRVAEAARDLCEADVVRIALHDGDRGMVYRWLLGTRATGYDRLVLEPGRGFAGRVLETGRPYRTADAAADPAVDPERGRYFIETEGVRTAMVVPIRSHGRITGLIYLARRTPRPFTDDDERMASRLADYAGVAVRNAESFAREQAARAEAESTERRASFLAQASVLMASSLDIEATLQSVARLAVPHLADICAVDMVVERGEIRRLAVVHADPAREKLAREVRERHGFNRTAQHGVPEVLRTGRPAFVPRVTDEHLRAAATSDEQLRLLRALGMTSWIIVPLAARGRVLGAITLVMADSCRRYGLADLAVAEDLGRRAAIAIDNAQLYQQAQTANRAKDEFLATLSHELRTPINAIYGWARMLRAGHLDAPTTARALEAIERNAQAQVQLIEDLLDVSRIISGKMRLAIRPIELAPVLEAALDAVRPAAAAKELRLQTALDPRAASIVGDPDRLQQVFWNLLMNAVKFTPKGGRIQVTLRRVNSHVEIAVSDTGIGLAPDVLPHVFERLWQGDRGTTRSHGGLGIGLALVRHLVESHGGTVHAASEGPGTGATFVVRLPIAVASLPAEPPLAAADAPVLHGVSVLVVDDDPDSRDLVRAMLAQAGAIVHAAGSAADGLTLFTAAGADVVLCDIEMPGEDGYSFLHRLRALAPGAGRRVPVAALTAYSGVRERIRALEAGFDMHVPKPVEPAELCAVVARLARRA